MSVRAINLVVGILMALIPLGLIGLCIWALSNGTPLGGTEKLTEDQSFYYVSLVCAYGALGVAGFRLITGRYPARLWCLASIPLWLVGTIGLRHGLWVTVPFPASPAFLELLGWYLVQFPPIIAFIGLFLPPYAFYIEVYD